MSTNVAGSNNPIDADAQPTTIEIDGTEYVARETSKHQNDRIEALEAQVETLTAQIERMTDAATESADHGDDTDTQQINTLRQRVAACETNLAQERAARTAAEERIDDLERQRRADIHALARELHEMRHHQEETDEQLTATDETTHVNRSRLDCLVEWKRELLPFLGVDPDEPLPDDPMDPQRDFEEAEVKVDSIAQTFIEKLTTLPEGVTNSANIKRARFLAMDLKQYATRGKNGWILDAERIKNALYAREQCPAATHDETVDRVRDILAENGGDDIVVGQQSHGKRKKIVQFSDNIVNRLSNIAKVREEVPSLVCERRIPDEG